MLAVSVREEESRALRTGVPPSFASSFRTKGEHEERGMSQIGVFSLIDHEEAKGRDSLEHPKGRSCNQLSTSLSSPHSTEPCRTSP